MKKYSVFPTNTIYNLQNRSVDVSSKLMIMKRLFLLTILITSVIQGYSQVNVDSMRIKSESVDSIEIIVHTTLPSCHLIDSIRHIIQQDSIIISFYYSEEFPQCDCLPSCQRQDLFKIKKSSHKKLIFNSFIRNCINNCTSYTEYSLYAKGVLSLPSTSVEVFDIEKKGEVTIFPNPVRDELLITKSSGGAFDIKIYDLSGKTFYEKKLYNSESINISDLPTGLYFLAIDHKTIHKLLKY